MDDGSEVLEEARVAYRSRDWPRAYELYTRAREAAGPLPTEDLASLSDAAWWLGHTDDFLGTGEACFRRYLDTDRPRDAAMTAVELAIALFLRGDEASGSGWMGRAQRLLADLPEGAEHGYVRYVIEVEGALDGPDLEAVAVAAADVQELGRRHGDPNLVAGGLVGEGRALIRLGDVARGMRLLDEAMLAVLHDDLAPEWAGNVYCHLMAACHELADIGRAREWTERAWSWLSRLSAAVLFTGICRVHRSQVHQIAGEWDRAEREAVQVLDDLAGLNVATVAEAHYQLGDLRRLRGDLDGAVDAYAQARRLGRDPQPGLALLCLAQDDVDAAAAGIRAALHAAGHDRMARARLCAAQVEVALAAGDLELARQAGAELEQAAAAYGTSGLQAAALTCRGRIAVAEDRPEEALPALRAACRRWHEVGATYEAARTCGLLGSAYERLGDVNAAVSELRAARESFEQLGAQPDGQAVGRAVDALVGERSLPGGLTAREAEVLALVADGLTNREVAEALVLSKKTIDRHLSNIFTKLDVSNRTEASAFAFTHGLVRSGRG
jgi:DNA-binding CsgD family transcriptional regulator